MTVNRSGKEPPSGTHSAPPSMGFLRDVEAQQREDELQLLTTVEKQVQGVLAAVQYIAEILSTNKTVAPVENINAKIKAAYEKIKALLNPDIDPDQVLEEVKRRTSGGINLEQNPLIKEMGGMPLEVISAEWSELIEGQILDKAELENMVNNKLKNRVELANRLKAKNQPKLRASPQMTPKFQKIRETLKYILKEMPPPPRPAPRTTIPPPRPMGM